MKIICSKNNLLKSINISMKAVPGKTTMDILQCILVDASAKQIRLISNDMELGIETIVEGTIAERGIVAIDAKILYEIIRRLPENDITISSDEIFNVTIKCEKSVFKIPGKPGDEFARLPYIEKDESLTLTQFMLKEMIRQTIFAIAVNENNPIMTGELFEIRNNSLRIVSLDGHRIAIRMLNLSNNYNDRKIIVPGKTLNEISKILSGEMDDQVSIFFSENHILFEFDETVVVSRLIEGEYFRVDHMLSGDYATRVNINKKDFYNCVDRATLLLKEGEKKPLVISISDNMMDISMNSPLGTMNEQLSIEKSGKDIVIGFNPRFLIDALRVIDDEFIDIYLVNPKAPCYIRDEDGNYIYLVLPVNIGNKDR